MWRLLVIDSIAGRSLKFGIIDWSFSFLVGCAAAVCTLWLLLEKARMKIDCSKNIQVSYIQRGGNRDASVPNPREEGFNCDCHGGKGLGNVMISE